MRRPTEPEAHRARAALIDGRVPPEMQARCAYCRQVSTASEGKFVVVEVPGTGHTRMFRCASCGAARDSAA